MKIVKGGKKGAENFDYHSYKEAFLNILKQFQKKSEPATENFHVAVIAWNIGNIKMQGVPGFEFLMETTKTSSGLTKKEWKLMQEMVEYRIKQFSNMPLFIKDIHNADDEENFTLEIIDMDEFIIEGTQDHIGDDFDDEFDDDDFDDDDIDPEIMQQQEGIINRDILIVTPTEEFLKFSGLDKRESVYFIPEFYDFEMEYKSWLRKNFKSIFELEICELDEDMWPKKLTFTLFEKYFFVRRLEMGYDLLSEPIYKE